MKSTQSALGSWHTLNAVIGGLTESELESLLKNEVENKRRPMIIKRLHQRLNRVRITRERKELLKVKRRRR